MEFTWNEVNCFLRPQVAYLNARRAPVGDLLLLLCSLHRTHRIGGFFFDRGQEFITFSSDVLGPMLQCRFEASIYLAAPGNVDELLGPTREGAAVLLPTNLSEISYSRYYRSGVWPHYFLATGSDPDGSIRVLDNLHTQPDGMGTRFYTHRLDRETLLGACRAYYEEFAGETQYTPAFHRETSFFSLALFDEASSDTDAILHRVVDHVRESLGRLADDDYAAMETRFLAAAREQVEAHAGDAMVQRYIRMYLVEANFCSVYLKLLADLADRSSGEGACMAAFTTWFASAARARTNVFVQLAQGRSISDEQFSATMASLRTERRSLEDGLMHSLCLA